MDSYDRTLVQVNQRLTKNLIILPKDIFLFFDILQILITPNIFQIHRIIMELDQQNGLLLYIREFLSKQKTIQFTKHTINEDYQWNFKEYLNIFLKQYPRENRLS